MWYSLLVHLLKGSTSMFSSNEDFIKLFDANGIEIPASKKSLLKIESKTFSKSFYKRLLGDVKNFSMLWLVSNRKGHTPMLLVVNVWGTDDSKELSEISYCVNGTASYAHFDIEQVISNFQKPYMRHETVIPDNVAELARQYVHYTVEPTLTKRELALTVRTLSPAKMRNRLKLITTSDTSELVESVAGRNVPIFELMMANTVHLQEQSPAAVAHLMVPLTQVPKLRRLTARLGAQIR